MAVGGSDEASAGQSDRAASAAPHHACLSLQVHERLADGDLVTVTYLRRELLITDPEQDAHALRGPEGQVEPGDVTGLERTAEDLTGPGVLTGEHPQQLLILDLAVEPKPAAAGADPAAGRFPLTGVVVLPALRHLVDVVAPRIGARSELSNREHTP